MPREILGGNSPRRAKLHQKAHRGGRGVSAPTAGEILANWSYNEIRDRAVELGVFEVGVKKAELAERISSAGG